MHLYDDVEWKDLHMARVPFDRKKCGSLFKWEMLQALEFIMNFTLHLRKKGTKFNKWPGLCSGLDLDLGLVASTIQYAANKRWSISKIYHQDYTLYGLVHSLGVFCRRISILCGAFCFRWTFTCAGLAVGCCRRTSTSTDFINSSKHMLIWTRVNINLW